MDANANNPTINPDGMPEESLSALWLRRIARVLLPVISLTISLQPVAFAAPSPSLLAQEPRFLDVSVESNVMFIMDDSLSMDDIRLPVPAGRDPGESAGGSVAVRGRATGVSGSGFTVVSTPNVSRTNDWIYRSSALNPLYYNPAITYTPWNDNGRAGVSGNFTNSTVGTDAAVTDPGNGFRFGLTPHDMRYAGPNYNSSGFSSARRLTTTGANPPPVPGYLSAGRPADGGFSGETDPPKSTYLPVPGTPPVGTRQQDIFSSPFVFVTSLVQTCIAGQIGQQTTGRATQAAPTAARPSIPVAYVPRPGSNVIYEPRPTTPVILTARPTAPLLTEARNSTPVIFSARPSTGAVTFSARPSTPVVTEARPFVPRGSTPRPTWYRIETGACGNWGPYTVLAAPPSGFCSDPSSEGGVRVALVQSELQPCASGPGGTETPTSCLADCSTGYTGGSAGGVPVCYSNTCTTSGYQLIGSVTSATQCQSPCTGNVIGGQCYTGCVAPLVLVGAAGTATQCQTPCAGNVIGGVCYTGCVAPLVLVGAAGTATQCQTPCVGGNVIAGLCYTTCPTTGYVFSGSAATATQCQLCAGNVIGGVCYTACLTGVINGSPATSTQCASTACTGGNVISGICYGPCTTTGYVFDGTAATATQCRSPCSGNIIAGQCYTGCGVGYELNGAAGSATQCRSICAGNIIGTNCYGACAPPTYSFVGSAATATQCRGPCTDPAYPNVHPSDPALCIASCPSGATTAGTTCLACPAGYTEFDTPVQCCPAGNLVTVGVGCPAGQTCGVAGRFYPNLNIPALARYFVFEPSTPIPSPTAADYSNSANYVLVEINRDRKHSYPKASTRTDCAGSTCTWDDETQNFANWYSYYRSRLFSAIAVSAQSLSGLTRSPSRLDSLRLGYGSINYFPNGFSPYPNFDPTLNPRFSGSFTLDGPPGNDPYGHIVRGVRPFTEVSPPPAPGSNDRRQETFDWLFSLRGIASTPNREALDAVGRYFTRADNQGPWIQPANTTTWSSSEDPLNHVSCRRNYAILITDGEWTNSPETSGSGQQQPVLGGSQRPGNAPAALAAQGGTPLNALTTTGPTHTRSGSGSPATYQYVPAGEPQFSGGAGSVTNTLSDVAFYYWSRDLRPTLDNNIKPIGSSSDTAFWQHLTPFIVGYGISASRDTAATRSAITAGTAITWNTVRVESRPTENPRTIVTDQDGPQACGTGTPPPNPCPSPATLLTCNYNPITNPSGCGRVNDTFRAAMAARSDFLAATDVSGLAASIAAAFARIGEVEGAATAFTGRSASVASGDRLYSASFVTNRWTGRVEAYDAVALNSAFQNGTTPPSAEFASNFPASGARNIVTSTAVVGSGTSFAWASLTTAQQAALGSTAVVSAAVLAWLRGDQTTEARNGGAFRNRPDKELMGDIVNSNPIYSKATDARYNSFRRPAAAMLATTPPSNAAVDYPVFVKDNRGVIDPLTGKLNPATGRPGAVYVGSNSGMMHAFNASDLSERFAYVPRAVYPLLSYLTAPGYVHRYYVDGPVVEGDVYINGAWRTVVVGTTGAGPKGVFALDVTQRSGTTQQIFSTGDVLWDIAGTDISLSNIAHLGNITQPGVIGSGKDGEWYYFTGNGWESGNDKARLLAIRIRDGAILSIATDNVGGPDPAAASVSGRPNGLGGVSPVYDGNRNIIAIYAGDRLGRLWKFDLSSSNTASWTVATGAPLFTAEDNSANRQPISAAPRVMAHPLGGRLIAFGTGRLTEGADIGSTDVQSIYAVWEKNPNAPVAVTRASLRLFTFTETGTAAARNRLRSLNGVSSLNWGTDNGWRVDLLVGSNAIGERVFVSPIEQAGFLNITSFEPIAGGDRCKGGGASFFYRFDIARNFTQSGIRAPGGAVQPPDVVGSEFLGTVGGLRIFGRASDTTAANLQVLDKTGLRDMLANPKKSAATDSCASAGPGGISILNAPTGGALAPCPSQAQRVWRELPRGRR